MIFSGIGVKEGEFLFYITTILSQGRHLIDNYMLVFIGITISLLSLCRFSNYHVWHIHLTYEEKFREEVVLKGEVFLVPLGCRIDCNYPQYIFNSMVNMSQRKSWRGGFTI